MAYEITGIFRYKVKELNHNAQILIAKESFAILTKDGKAISKQIALDLLCKSTTDYSNMRTLQNAYLYVKRSYTHSGNASTKKAAKRAFKRDAYIFYPQCVHVSAIRRFPVNKPIAVDL